MPAPTTTPEVTKKDETLTHGSKPCKHAELEDAGAVTEHMSQVQAIQCLFVSHVITVG